MSQAAIEKIDEIFGDPDKFSPENLESLVKETFKFFDGIKTQLDSPDEKVRHEALKLAMQLKNKLEEQALAICKSVGMDPEVLESYINNPAHFSPEEWQAIEKAKADLNSYKQEIIAQNTPAKEPASKPVHKKKGKAVKEWLIG